MCKKKRYIRMILLLTFVFCMLPFVRVQAAKPTDEITDYTIKVDVNDDGTLKMTYDITWKVLESDTAGPLSWVQIGIPNRYCVLRTPLSDTIDRMTIDGTKCLAKIYFKNEYYEGDVVQFSFMITMDNMYQMNGEEAGYTVYSFTPGWFDEIAVDHLKIMWKEENASSWSPSCIVEDGYNVWETSLAAGEKYTIKMVYPNDAYAFKVFTKHEAISNNEDDIVVFVTIFVTVVVFIIICLVAIIIAQYSDGCGFGVNTTVIKRTRVVYYPACPSCGSAREEGSDSCKYCGGSMIKSKEVITEKDVPEQEKAVMRIKKSGTYHYQSDPNTVIKVNVINRAASVRGSSAVHRSSCACVHSSCACACACACAGGGRAGCTTKDFYRTNLKLSYLSRSKS